MTQIEKEETQRLINTFVNKHEVLGLIEKQFDLVRDSMSNRSLEQQTLIGNFITVVESELKNDIKKLTEKLIE